MNKILTSIVILNFNGLNDTKECVNSILKSQKNYLSHLEILVCDNGSLVNEAKILQQQFKAKIKVLRFQKNLGFTGGNNAAISHVKGKYVLLLNNDTLLVKNCIVNLVKALDQDSTIGVVQPKIKYYYDKSRFDYAGACGGFIDLLGYPFTRGRLFENQEMDVGQYDTRTNLFWASGAALMFRKSLLKVTGGLFDNTFFNYMEEIDFCWRVLNSNFRVISEPSAVVYHKVAATSKNSPIKKRLWEHRNNLLLLVKNLSSSDLWKVFLLRLPLELVTYFYYLITGKFNYVLALLFGHIHFMVLLPSMFSRRVKTAKKLNVLPVYQGSVCVDFFLRGKNTFQKLNWKTNEK